MKKRIIGIVGGMGPFAGMDVHSKIYQNTLSSSDQGHIDIIHYALSRDIPDRSDFLLGKTPHNPGEVLANKMITASLGVIGIACNTFHAPKIFDAFKSKLSISNTTVLSLPNEIKKVVEEKYPTAKIGVLCTLGTYQSRLYQNTFKDNTVTLKFPDPDGCIAIHQAIFHPDWGIKRNGKLSDQAKMILENEIQAFSDVEAVLLACTELPLAVDQLSDYVPLIDCNSILARGLINAVAPNKLR